MEYLGVEIQANLDFLHCCYEISTGDSVNNNWRRRRHFPVGPDDQHGRRILTEVHQPINQWLPFTVYLQTGSKIREQFNQQLLKVYSLKYTQYSKPRLKWTCLYQIDADSEVIFIPPGF